MATTTEAQAHSRARFSVAHDGATAGAAILLRLAAAYLWYENLSWKNPPDFGKSDGGGLYGFTHAAVTNPVLGVWSSVIENVVLPNFVIFGWFTLVAETCLAIFLFLGLATRFWALVGVAQSFAIYFTVGGLPAEWKWSYFLMAATHLALLGLAAGRVPGLDQLLRPRVTGPSLLAPGVPARVLTPRPAARPVLLDSGVDDDLPPLLRPKNYAAPSLFEPVNLLREARRQRGLPVTDVPRVALLDPDGDIVRYLSTADRGIRHPGWACFHTDMWTTDLDGTDVEVVGMAVGAPFAVLVAEQVAVSGAELLVSITSAGQIAQLPRTPCFVLIERALRDEGTSVPYQPPGRWSQLDPRLRERLDGAFDGLPEPVIAGASWTTDASYRETADQIASTQLDGAVCVEMEAAALYAYATARDRAVVCLAHVTNTTAARGSDFEKGPANGVHAALAVAGAVARAWVGPGRDR